jgi:nucleotide-binding universal stress UspA family protein
VLARLTALAGEHGLAPETLLVSGTPGPVILRVAREWSADLVVVGRAGRAAQGEPYVGSQTRHVLEFSDRPVLVVPQPPRATTGR